MTKRIMISSDDVLEIQDMDDKEVAIKKSGIGELCGNILIVALTLFFIAIMVLIVLWGVGQVFPLCGAGF